MMASGWILRGRKHVLFRSPKQHPLTNAMLMSHGSIRKTRWCWEAWAYVFWSLPQGRLESSKKFGISGGRTLGLSNTSTRFPSTRVSCGSRTTRALFPDTALHLYHLLRNMDRSLDLHCALVPPCRLLLQVVWYTRISESYWYQASL